MTNHISMLLVALLLAVAPAGALGQRADAPPTGRELEELTRQVASELRCPVCRQLSVQDSQAELSREVKDLIRDRLASGESPEEVKAYFVSKYGEWILLAPPKQGFTLLVWVLPLAAVGAGALVLALFFRRWLGGGEGPHGAPDTLGEEGTMTVGPGSPGWERGES